MEIKSMQLPESQYYPNVTEKKTIILHHTAGTSASGAIDWWKHTLERVGTAFVIERNGTIYQAFDPKYWAYGLGVKGATNFEKQCIQIELVSCGWLKELDLPKTGKGIYFTPVWPNLSTVKKIDESEILKINYRGEKYYHKYTDSQVKSALELVKHLVEKFNIKVQKDLDKFWEYNPDVIAKSLQGIYSHTTVRKDKTDIFPQENLISGLKDLFKIKA